MAAETMSMQGRERGGLVGLQGIKATPGRPQHRRSAGARVPRVLCRPGDWCRCSRCCFCHMALPSVAQRLKCVQAKLIQIGQVSQATCMLYLRFEAAFARASQLLLSALDELDLSKTALPLQGQS